MTRRQSFRPANLDVLEGRVVLSAVAGLAAAEVRHEAAHVQHQHHEAHHAPHDHHQTHQVHQDHQHPHDHKVK